ncbi:hypothetical protein [Parasutterella sp.]|uniref:hypothetical protein n=1 Tax=Parasutterella sp. TaxID=2049037 RepID=UPI003520D6D3
MLKSLLTLLLSKFLKREDTEFMASQPMAGSSSNKVILKDNVTGDIEVFYTAPSNGWIFVNTGNGVKSVNIQDFRSGLSLNLDHESPESHLMQWIQEFLPVAKGDNCRICVLVNSGNTSSSSVFFIPSIGG